MTIKPPTIGEIRRAAGTLLSMTITSDSPISPGTRKWLLSVCSELSDDERLALRRTLGVSTREDAWLDQLNEVSEFFTTNSRLPSKASLDPRESSLGAWVVRQRLPGAADAQQRAAIINQKCPEILVSRLDAWMDSAEEFSVFVKSQGRLPQRRVADPDERRLSAWMQNVRQRVPSMGGPQLKALEKLCPELLETRPDPWLQRLQETARFHSTHGTLPLARSSDSGERCLGVWVKRQRRDVAVLSPEQVESIEEICPSILNKPSRRTWSDLLDEVVSFTGENGELPARSGGSQTEIRLAAWISRQRKSPSTRTPEQEREMNRRCPGILSDGPDGLLLG